VSEEFERAFAELQGCDHCVAVTTGTSALRCALRAVGVEAGDEVIIPPYTFMATGTAVIDVSATPVWADIHPETWTLDPAAFEAGITSRTRAVIPVHVAGNPCMMDEITEIAERYGIAVVEDAAQAHGAIYSGTPVGGLGDAGCFSFQASKNLSGGEGGAVTTNDRLIAERVWSVHNCGRYRDKGWYEHPIMGSNERITEFQSAVLLAQLSRFKGQFDTRLRNAAVLTELLEPIEGVSGARVPGQGSESAVHLYLVNYDPRAFGGLPRERLLEALGAEGIPSSSGYTPLYKAEMFDRGTNGRSCAERYSGRTFDFSKVCCPECERICNSAGFWIYQKHFLGTEGDMSQIAEAVKKIQDNVSEIR
jgi:dTDP-4-amino-4,6-dideoxygalactose transaminase